MWEGTIFLSIFLDVNYYITEEWAYANIEIFAPTSFANPMQGLTLRQMQNHETGAGRPKIEGGLFIKCYI